MDISFAWLQRSDTSGCHTDIVLIVEVNYGLTCSHGRMSGGQPHSDAAACTGGLAPGVGPGAAGAV